MSLLCYSINLDTELSHFIKVCEHTAEEEFSLDRLANLHSVGTEFAPLIYDLPNDAGFEQFNQKCCTVYNILLKNSKLVGSLVSKWAL